MDERFPRHMDVLIFARMAINQRLPSAGSARRAVRALRTLSGDVRSRGVTALRAVTPVGPFARKRGRRDRGFRPARGGCYLSVSQRCVER
jgi:hypothetical protein